MVLWLRNLLTSLSRSSCLSLSQTQGGTVPGSEFENHIIIDFTIYQDHSQCHLMAACNLKSAQENTGILTAISSCLFAETPSRCFTSYKMCPNQFDIISNPPAIPDKGRGVVVGNAGLPKIVQWTVTIHHGRNITCQAICGTTWLQDLQLSSNLWLNEKSKSVCGFEPFLLAITCGSSMACSLLHVMTWLVWSCYQLNSQLLNSMAEYRAQSMTQPN